MAMPDQRKSVLLLEHALQKLCKLRHRYFGTAYAFFDMQIFRQQQIIPEAKLAADLLVRIMTEIGRDDLDYCERRATPEDYVCEGCARLQDCLEKLIRMQVPKDGPQ